MFDDFYFFTRPSKRIKENGNLAASKIFPPFSFKRGDLKALNFPRFKLRGQHRFPSLSLHLYVYRVIQKCPSFTPSHIQLELTSHTNICGLMWVIVLRGQNIFDAAVGCTASVPSFARNNTYLSLEQRKINVSVLLWERSGERSLGNN